MWVGRARRESGRASESGNPSLANEGWGGQGRGKAARAKRMGGEGEGWGQGPGRAEGGAWGKRKGGRASRSKPRNRRVEARAVG